MRFTRALIPTLKEAPHDATNTSHALLVRAGYIRRIGAGIYDYLPLGLRVLRRIEALVRSEMDRAGALEVLLPALLPAEYFKETGRWDRFGDTLFRLKGRGVEYNLGPTHEEIITDLARREIRSHRDLPKNLYQIQTKFRNEERPRGGLLRCREFVMKDAYSFDTSEEAALASYERMRVAYTKIFDRMKLDYRMVAADSGAMGGITSAEFQVLADSGEDSIVACTACDYAANVEAATVRDPAVDEVAPSSERVKVHTPGHRTIDEICAFLAVPPARLLKSLVYVAGDVTVMAVVRGDHAVNEVQLARALGVDAVHLAGEAEVQRATGAAVGFAGPVGFTGRIVVDRAAAALRDAACGANESDHHYTGVAFGRDFTGDVVAIRLATAGDPCPRCEGQLQSYRGIEAGHIFVLGTHYSSLMKATYLDSDQTKKPFVMGCYGIGISRLIATALEQHNDANGMRWPMCLSPYHVHLCTLGTETAITDAARTLYDTLWAAGIEVLWDDRAERPGTKFADADLIGIPLRVTVGARGLAAGTVELKLRSEQDVRNVELVPIAEAATTIADRVRGLA